MVKTPVFKGSCTAIVTPFCEHGVDYERLRKNIDFQYEKLMDYVEEHKLKVNGFSREITMIDYGLTNDTEKFVTEISIPVT